MTAADWEFVSTGPNTDPARDSTSEGGIFGGAGRTLRPSFSLGGSGSGRGSGSGGLDRADGEPAGQRQSAASTDKKLEQEENGDTTPAVLPGHARAWFSLPADGVLDSFLLLQYLRSVLCADGLMKILHCANEQQQRPARVESPPLPPPQSPEAGKKRQQPQQQRQLHQLSPPPKIDVSFKGGRGHRRRSTGTSPLAHAYSHSDIGGASGAASVGGGRGRSVGADGEQTSTAAKAVVAAAVGKAMFLAVTNTESRRHSGGSGRTTRRVSGRRITTERSGHDLEVRDGSDSSTRGGSTSVGGSEPSSSVVKSITTKAPQEKSNSEVAVAAEAKAGEQILMTDKPDRQGQAAGRVEEGEDTDRTSLQEGVLRERGGVDSACDKSGHETLETDRIEDVEIDQADMNFVYSSWQPRVPRSDPAAKRTATAARKVRAEAVLNWHELYLSSYKKRSYAVGFCSCERGGMW